MTISVGIYRSLCLELVYIKRYADVFDSYSHSVGTMCFASGASATFSCRESPRSDHCGRPCAPTRLGLRSSSEQLARIAATASLRRGCQERQARPRLDHASGANVAVSRWCRAHVLTAARVRRQLAWGLQAWRPERSRRRRIAPDELVKASPPTEGLVTQRCGPAVVDVMCCGLRCVGLSRCACCSANSAACGRRPQLTP